MGQSQIDTIRQELISKLSDVFLALAVVNAKVPYCSTTATNQNAREGSALEITAFSGI